MGETSPGAGRLWSGLHVRAGFLTATAGLAVVNAVALAVGFLAKALQEPVDTPVFERIDAAGTNAFTDVLVTVTKMGNVFQTQVLTAVGAVLLAVWFFRRGTRWWIPLVAMPTAWLGARGFQMIQAKVVGRDREVLALIGTEIGSYPSGGVARIILVAGMVTILVSHYLRSTRRTTTLMWVGVAVLGFVEAVARTRLNQHWLTDVVGGAIFGAMFLVVAITTLRAFDPDPGHGDREVTRGGVPGRSD